MFRHCTALVAAAGCAALCGGGLAAQGQPITHSDSQLRNADWTLFGYRGGPGGSIGATQIGSGGNGGAFRRTTHVHRPSSRSNESHLWGFHRYARALYRPATQGAIAGIDFAVDAKLFEVIGLDGFTVGPALFQNGRIYAARLFSTPEARWTRKSMSRLAADRFHRWNPFTLRFEPGEHPDFSSGAPTIRFGYVQGTSHTGGSYQRRRVGFDNWRVTVRRAPPPDCRWADGATQMYAIVRETPGASVLIVDQNAPWTGPAPPPGTAIGTDNDARIGRIGIDLTTAGHRVVGEARDVPFGAGRQLTLTRCRVTRRAGSATLHVCLGSARFAPLPPLIARVLLVGVASGFGSVTTRMTGRVPGLAPLVAAGSAPPTPPWPSFFRPFVSVSPFVPTPAGVRTLRLDVDFAIDRIGTGVWLPTSAKLTVDRPGYPQAILSASGTPSPGGSIDYGLSSPADAGLSYVLLHSLGSGPMRVGSRLLELSPDPLFVVSAGLPGHAGFLDGEGWARVRLALPEDAALRGLVVYSAFVTGDARDGIASLSNAFAFEIR